MAHMKRGYVPSEPIRELVDEYVGSRDMGTVDHQCGLSFSATDAVAKEFGTSERSLRDFVAGRRFVKEIPFDMADRWLCKMGRGDHPWAGLTDIYYACDLRITPSGEELEERRRRHREWDREDRRKRKAEWLQRRYAT